MSRLNTFCREHRNNKGDGAGRTCKSNLPSLLYDSFKVLKFHFIPTKLLTKCAPTSPGASCIQCALPFQVHTSEPLSRLLFGLAGSSRVLGSWPATPGAPTARHMGRADSSLVSVFLGCTFLHSVGLSVHPSRSYSFSAGLRPYFANMTHL